MNSSYEFDSESSKWYVPNECLAQLHNFTIGSNIGAGAYGHIFEFCESKDACNKIIKLVPLDSMPLSRFNREAKITQMASDIGVSPRFDSAFTCPNVLSGSSAIPLGFIIQDRWNITALDFFYETGRVSLPPGVKQRLKQKLERLHAAGIAHNDLHQGNVILKTTRNERGQLVLQDVALIYFDAAVLKGEPNFEQVVEADNIQLENI